VHCISLSSEGAPISEAVSLYHISPNPKCQITSAHKNKNNPPAVTSNCNYTKCELHAPSHWYAFAAEENIE